MHTVKVHTEPLKSSFDQKAYRSIELQNGLRVLLISDPKTVPDNQVTVPIHEECGENEAMETEEDGVDEEEESDDEDEVAEITAAAALCIRVGSFSDPEDIPGLAHFLEHMVYMGSEKYPEENALEVIVRNNGGEDNASTDCELTSFYFDVNQSHFEEAMDCFAQFFIHPLLLIDSMDRERKAVDSEFSIALPNDEHRREMLLGSMAKEGHPYRKFMWGNYNTLKPSNMEDVQINNKLRQFFNEHYSAHQMTLAIQAPRSLDALQELAIETFGKVPSSKKPGEKLSGDWSGTEYAEPFNTDKFMKKLYRVVSLKDENSVVVTWALPPQLSYYKEKPLEYLEWIFSYEGKGSILAYLRERHWAVGLSAGNDGGGFQDNSTASFFSIIITLTDAGFTHLYEVLSAVFSHIRVTQHVGPEERIFREIQIIYQMTFEHREETCPSDWVEALAQNMQFCPSEEYIRGDELLYTYDRQLIKTYLDLLTPERANIIFWSKEFSGDLNCNEQEYWFKTQYGVEDVPEKWIQDWGEFNPELDAHFYTPRPNPFISSDFQLVTQNATFKDEMHPQKIMSNTPLDLWYRRDDKFERPKAYIYYYLMSERGFRDVHARVYTSLWANILNQQLSPELYDAELAKLGYDLYSADHGICCKLSGFSHKLPVLSEALLKFFSNFKSCSEGLYAVMLAEQRKHYYNYLLKPSKLALLLRRFILDRDTYLMVEKYNTLLKCTKVEDFIAYTQEFRNQLHVKVLVQGNLRASESEELVMCYKDTLQQLLPIQEGLKGRTNELPHGESCCRVMNLNPHSGNSVVVSYFQFGPATIRQEVTLNFITFLMAERVFDVLRTKEQLGYDVRCERHDTNGIIGFSVLVITQAVKNKTSFVDSRIMEFLKDFNGFLKALDPEEFSYRIAALIRMKETADVNLGQEVDRNWHEIVSEEYLFNRLRKEVECLKDLKIEEVLDMYSKLTSPANPSFRKLSVWVDAQETVKDIKDIITEEEPGCPMLKLHYLPGVGEDQSHHRKFIQDAAEFKRHLKMYPISKIVQ